MNRFAALFAVLVIANLGVSTARADESDLLQSFAGPWRGTGAVRTAGDAPTENLVCRVDGQVDGTGNALELSGRCGSERFTGTFHVSLTYDPAASKYVAIWRDSLGSKSPPLTGLRSGDRLVFRVRHNDFETDGRAISTLVVDPQTSQFRIFGRTEPAVGGDDFVSANLIFVRG